MEITFADILAIIRWGSEQKEHSASLTPAQCNVLLDAIGQMRDELQYATTLAEVSAKRDAEHHEQNKFYVAEILRLRADGDLTRGS